MSILYVLRRPRFPVIVVIGDQVFRAVSSAAVQKLLRRPPEVTDVRLLDSDWAWFKPISGEVLAIAPSFSDFQPPTKQFLVALVNDRSNKTEASPSYMPRSFSSRSREEIFQELLAILPAG